MCSRLPPSFCVTTGISGEMNVRDLWKHVDEGKASSLTANVPAHGCKIVKLTK